MKNYYYLSIAFLSMLFLGTSLNSVSQTAAVVQPTSTGIVWLIGDSHNITWTTDQNKVDVDYGIFNGTVWSYVNIADDATTTSIVWNTTGLTPGVYYKIFIREKNSTTGNNILAQSANYFELTDTYNPPAGDGTIHVNQPDVAGIQWEPGTQHGIYWDDDLVEPVKLELWFWDTSLTPDAYAMYTGTTGLPTSVEGTGYIWTIDASIPEGSRYKIKVMSTTTDVFDFGENDFALTSTFSGGTEVNMLQPDVEGLQWESGTTHLVSWMDDLIENVYLELYEEDPNNAGEYIVYVPVDVEPASNLPTDRAGTTVDWDIPAGLPNGNYKVYASSSVTPSIDNFSEYPFAITDTPSGGTTITLIQPEETGIQWLFGGTYVISWMDDLIEPVDIELWRVGGATKITTLEPSAVGTTWDWTIPAEGTNGIDDDDDYLIKIVSSATPPTTSDITTNPFEITATPSGGTEIVVIQPSIDGIEWEIGTDHLISWMDDLIEPVRIKLFDHGTANDYFGAANSGIPDVDRPGTTWVWADIPAG